MNSYSVHISWLPARAATVAVRKGLVYRMCASCGNTNERQHQCVNCDLEFKDYVDADNIAGEGRVILTQSIPVYPAMIRIGEKWFETDRVYQGQSATDLAEYPACLVAASVALLRPLNKAEGDKPVAWAEAVMTIAHEIVVPFHERMKDADIQTLHGREYNGIRQRAMFASVHIWDVCTKTAAKQLAAMDWSKPK